MQMYHLKLLRPIVVRGAVVPANTVIEVDEAQAKNLLYRGKAELAVADSVQEKPKRGRRANVERQPEVQPDTEENDHA